MSKKSGVFISYRRGPESDWAAIGLRDGIRQRFPSAEVFHDGDSIDPGARWPDRLRAGLGACAVLLALLGPSWTRVQHGRRLRLDIERDWVRNELLHALSGGVEVIPVLLDGAEPPSREELPDCLHPLCDLQAARLRSADDEADRSTIFSRLEAILPPLSRTPRAIAPAPPRPSGQIAVADAASLIAEAAADPWALFMIARGQLSLGREGLAVELFRQALAKFRDQHGDEARETLMARQSLASACMRYGDSVAAEGILSELLGVGAFAGENGSRRSRTIRSKLATAILNQGRAVEAERMFCAMIAAYDASDEKSREGHQITLHNYARSLLFQRRHAEAGGFLRRILRTREAPSGSSSGPMISI